MSGARAANKADSVFAELGATRILECWGDDVPDGKRTDFRRAVQATDAGDVVFSWIEWLGALTAVVFLMSLYVRRR